MTEPATKIPSLALIPYYGPAPRAHHEAVRRSGLRVLCTDEEACIDAARAILLESALRVEGVEIFVFIDSDVIFNRAGYDLIVESCQRTRGVVGGLYALKGTSAPTAAYDPSLGQREDGLCVADRLGMGFTAIHREAALIITEHSKLGKVWIPTGPDAAMLCAPLFLPMIRDQKYLKEDFAFCVRAEEAGVKLFVDPRPELIHVGVMGFQVAQGLDRGVKR